MWQTLLFWRSKNLNNKNINSAHRFHFLGNLILHVKRNLELSQIFVECFCLYQVKVTNFMVK